MYGRTLNIHRIFVVKHAGWYYQHAANGYVSSSGHGNGVSSKNETRTQRLGSEKLHVSICTTCHNSIQVNVIHFPSH